MRIYSKSGKLNEADRLDLAKLLIKAGYIVSFGKEKEPGKTSYKHFIEYKETWTNE